MSEQKKTYAERYVEEAARKEARKEEAPKRTTTRRKRNTRKKKHSQEFSKWLLVQETALIWITTLTFLVLAFICIKNQYFGELPWLTAMAAFPWTAYGCSQAFYYKKAEKENTKGGIVYEKAIGETDSEYDNNAMG